MFVSDAQVRMSHLFEGVIEIGDLEGVTIQECAQSLNSLFLHLLCDLKKNNGCP